MPVPLPPPVRRVVELLAANPSGLTRDDLVAYVRAHVPNMPAARLSRLVGEGLAAGALIERAGRLYASAVDEDTDNAEEAPPRSGPLRAVIVDVESVVRTTATEPYTDKRIYQIGAARTGADTVWVQNAPDFRVWVALPDEEWVIRSEEVRHDHALAALPPREALAALADYLRDADLVVAYNGFEADFPLLAAACEREGLPPLGGEYVDAYYLALAIWPIAASHRLGDIAATNGIDTSDLSWHDAGDDCVLLARVLDAAAEAIAAWPADLINLVASIAPDSPGWTLLRELAGHGRPIGVARGHAYAHVAAVIETCLAGHTPRRASPGTRPAGREPLQIPDSLRGSDGKVSVTLLARAVHGRTAATRAAQVEMTATLHAWADAGFGGMLEAPTGTGKSLAVLAAALEWLSGAPERVAIISTFTKQLQAQLAHDVAVLTAAVPGILDATDVVKGARNRLSLRGLLAAAADATWLESYGRRRPGNRFIERVVFRELVVFLLLRLVASTDRLSSWAAHSVDPVDVPMFFGSYSNNALPAWLDSLSQGTNGEYAPYAVTPVAAHTDLVSEALAGHRLVLANHALLLAHTDGLSMLGPETMLVVDEAHQLEDAATSALTTSLDYRVVEDLYGDLSTWVADHRREPTAAATGAAVANLGALLDHENLPRTGGLAFDARSAGVGTVVGSRTVTLASPYAGVAGVPQVRTLAGLLTRLAGVCASILGALAAYLRVHGSSMDFFDVERLNTLLARCSTTIDTASGIVDDLDMILAPGPAPSPTSAQPPSAAPDDEDDDTYDANVIDEFDEFNDADDGSRDGDDDNNVATTSRSPAPPLPNQVVFAAETDALRGSLRWYRFRLSSAPIELPVDIRWQQFLSTFACTYYVSATLRVAGDWAYVRTRLGLPAELPTLALDSPFDLAEQAELVCFTDFPSWAEQSDGAMRTVAHQLARYAAEMVRPVRGEDDGGRPRAIAERGGFDGGAMMLTTARSTAGGIADYLATELRRAGRDVPVHSALVVGNPRVVASFTDPEFGGGLLVGTRGLWQGVDVADENRLRLVWVNKLPFAPFADPVVEARRAAVAVRAEAAGAEDPDAVATEEYYLPLAALGLRQAVGRMIRSERHRGVVVISDRKLAGQTALRRAYRRVFLGSLDPGLLRVEPDTGEPTGGNVMSMAEGWARIWRFYARHGLIAESRADELCTAEALAEHTLLPQTRRIRSLTLTVDEVVQHSAAGTLADEVIIRSAQVGGLLRLSDDAATLKPSQEAIIRAVADGRNVLGLLPTGFGKSFCFQLPALVLPGVTLVVSPLVALMHDQALELNRSIGSAVRALISPLRESSSRAGKTEVADQLQGRADHGIRLVYVSPERLCQRRFRELVRSAVAAGRVSRIALDEAHTFVQWGDDFRPSFRRVEQFLAQLRAEFGLPVTALTATANRTVHAGLREGVFGLAADPPEGGDGDALVTVTENPIRPELAVFRRALNRAGPSLVAGLTEEVLDKIDDHAIFYCLTVREVVALHAHLREYLGHAGVRVRRFHARLTEAEKAAVMTEFREAPRKGEDGFAPLVVVATSAFGLGINRPDVRTVFCVSPPTDLAALYQQLGRAGRDAAGIRITGAGDPAEDGTDAISRARTVSGSGADGNGAVLAVRPANVGLTLMTTRGLRTVAWMTGQDLPAPLLARMGRAVLRCGGVLDAARVAETLLAQDLASGVLTEDQARSRYTQDTYATGVVRAFAALAGLGAVTDLGDFPPLAAVKAGELFGHGYVEEFDGAVVRALLALPVRGEAGRLHRLRMSIIRADVYLARAVPGYRDAAEDPAGTWLLLADLHDRGLLDVSAAPSRSLIAGVAIHAPDLPDEYAAVLAGKSARAAAEVAALRAFFSDLSTCANAKIADYFGVEVPDGCCTSAENRCSACWDYRDDWPAEQKRPPVADAFDTPRPRPAGWRLDAATKVRRLDEQVRLLCWLVDRGLSAAHLYRALRGQDSWYLARARRRVRLPNAVLTSRHFGANPAVTLLEVHEALARLAADGVIVAVGSRWCDAGNLTRRQHRRAQSAQQAASAQATGPVVS